MILDGDSEWNVIYQKIKCFKTWHSRKRLLVGVTELKGIHCFRLIIGHVSAPDTAISAIWQGQMGKGSSNVIITVCHQILSKVVKVSKFLCVGREGGDEPGRCSIWEAGSPNRLIIIPGKGQGSAQNGPSPAETLS